jgi:hypothetical protein
MRSLEQAARDLVVSTFKSFGEPEDLREQPRRRPVAAVDALDHVGQRALIVEQALRKCAHWYPSHIR